MATTFLEAGTDSTQDLSFFAITSATNGTIASATDQFHTGPRSLKANVTLSGGVGYAVTANGVVQDAGTRTSTRVRFSTVSPLTPTLFLCPEVASDANAIIGVGITGGKLRLCGRGCTAVDGTITLSANTWYRLAFSWNITTSSNWSSKVFVYDDSNTLLETITTGNVQGTLTSTASSCMLYGINKTASVDTFGTSAVMSIWYDDIYVDNGTGVDDPGNISVTSKRPNANGTVNGFTTQVGAGGSGYGTGHSPQVNEQPLSVTNGWSMIGAGSAVTEEYNIESVSTGDVNITGATLVDYIGWVYTKAALAETGQIVINNVNSNIALVNANTMFTKVAGSTTYPAGTGTDIGEITATTVTTVSLYECGIIFAYIAASGGGPTSGNTTQFFNLLGIGT